MHQVLLPTLRRKLWAPYPWKCHPVGICTPRRPPGGHAGRAVEPVGRWDQQRRPRSAAAGRQGVGGREGDTGGPGQLHPEEPPGEGVVSQHPHSPRWERTRWWVQVLLKSAALSAVTSLFLFFALFLPFPLDGHLFLSSRHSICFFLCSFSFLFLLAVTRPLLQCHPLHQRVSKPSPFSPRSTRASHFHPQTLPRRNLPRTFWSQASPWLGAAVARGPDNGSRHALSGPGLTGQERHRQRGGHREADLEARRRVRDQR